MPKGAITPQQIRRDYKRAKIVDEKWAKEAREDLKFALGEQWLKADRDALDAQGRPALTFNIIQPLIFLAAGYQRNSRSTIHAFPEGGEDQIKSDIATALIKKVCQRSKVENNLSLRFEEGIMSGKAYIEPYIDYTNDLVNGELKFRGRNPFKVRLDPDSVEYTFDDAEFLIIEDYYTRKKLMDMFPEHKSEIKKIEPAKDPLEDDANILGETGDLGVKKTREEDEATYDNVFGMDEQPLSDDEEEAEGEETLHYIEYQYRKFVTQYLAADATRGKMQLFKTKAEAQTFLDQLRLTDPLTIEVVMMIQAKDPTFDGQEKQKVIPRTVPQMRVAFMIEDTIIDDVPSPNYPQWKSYSLIPFFAHYTPLARSELQRDDLAYQGMVRCLKDPQKEKNKRRSQTLHHLNTSANSGWISMEGAWVDKTKVDSLGSSAGVILEYKADKEKPERITPVPLSKGHLVMEESAEQDIKTISGINADMLAMDDKTTSGRAIALRQQQGFLMLKRVFDNFSWTQELVGKFILTQLGKLFTVENAAKVLGEEFLVKNMITPAMIDSVLNDADLGLYDVSIGEGQDSPTTRYANFTVLSEMAEKGYPIPPDLLIEYSDVPDVAKKRILTFMQQQQALAPAEASKRSRSAPGNSGRGGAATSK